VTHSVTCDNERCLSAVIGYICTPNIEYGNEKSNDILYGNEKSNDIEYGNDFKGNQITISLLRIIFDKSYHTMQHLIIGNQIITISLLRINHIIQYI
jgi:hypothetical protein